MYTVEVRYVYRSRNGQLVHLADEAGARAVVDRFGHATSVTPVADEHGQALLVSTPTMTGTTGGARLHAMACAAGLLAAFE